MREIKFRAWDKETKRIREVTRIDFACKTADLFHITPANNRSYLHQRKFDDIEVVGDVYENLLGDKNVDGRS